MSEEHNIQDPTHIVDERSIPPQLVDVELEHSSSEQSFHEENLNSSNVEESPNKVSKYAIYRITDIAVFNGIYVLAQKRIGPERGSQPGVTTPLQFAKQIRDHHFEIAQQDYKHNGVCHIYAGTVGCFPPKWVQWINSVATESDHDIWSEISQHENPTSGDLTPNGLHRSTMSSPPLSAIVRPAHQSDDLETSPQLEERLLEHLDPLSIRSIGLSDLDILNGMEDLSLELFEETPPNMDSLNLGQDRIWFSPSTPLRLHRHSTSFELSSLHTKLSLLVTFSDLFLNLVNTLCMEFQTLSEYALLIQGLIRPTDTKYLRAYKVLLLYVRSSQPPFKVRDEIKDFPVLHLELFFTTLVSSGRIIKDPKIPLKHYIGGAQLNIDRYSALISEAYILKTELFKTQGIVTRSSPSPIRGSNSRRLDLW